MANHNLSQAKRAKNDEFYTQYGDIEKEVNAYLEFDPDTFRGKVVLLPCDDPDWSNFTRYFAQNFKRLGLKRLVGTSYAEESKTYKTGREIPKWEREDARFCEKKAVSHGKRFVVERDLTQNGRIDFEDLEWEYLKGDGDFRSDEVTKLRDEADIIVTNPPFSLFREFLTWIGNKKFLVIGNMNAITYKEVFPRIKNDEMWLGATGNGSDMVFSVPKDTEIREEDKKKAERLGYKGHYTRLGNSCWFTNLDHGRRHEPLSLMVEADVVKYGSKAPFQKYDNYDAIEVPKTKWIPSDYKGVMGVPISFLDKYCPEQFEIVHCNDYIRREGVPKKDHGLVKDKEAAINGQPTYVRVLIRHKKPSKS